MKKFENKTVIITGGAGGIGLAAGKIFAKQGAHVLLIDLNEKELVTAVEKINDAEKVSYYVADVTQEDQVNNYVNAAIERYGSIDCFINNAGIEGVVAPIIDSPTEQFDQVIAVNVRGVWLGLKYVIPNMLKNGGGRIVMTSSLAGIKGTANISPYVTSKHAVIGMMRCAALEGAGDRIRVNTVNPSPVETRMMRALEDGMMPGDGQAAHASIAAGIPLGHYAEPSDIAAMMCFLASDEARFMTGGVYMVDGGISAK